MTKQQFPSTDTLYRAQLDLTDCLKSLIDLPPVSPSRLSHNISKSKDDDEIHILHWL